MRYEIAGLKVEMEAVYDRLRTQSRDYASDGTPVMHIRPDPRDEAMAALGGADPGEREYICAGAAFCRGIVPHGRFFLHASAVVSGGQAYLFSAPSGTGKSTHTALWLTQFPGSYILNDDKPVLCPGEKGVTVWGTPFSGKTTLQVNREVPLGGICFLKQGREDRIRPLSEGEALAMLLDNTWRPRTGWEMGLLLDLVERVITQTKCYELCCTPRPEAAVLAYKTMKGT